MTARPLNIRKGRSLVDGLSQSSTEEFIKAQNRLNQWAVANSRKLIERVEELERECEALREKMAEDEL